MRHTLPLAPQFYVTAPQPCPYLDGRMERKLFTALQGENAHKLNDSLSQQGFRRSQNVLYRPSCADCSACLSARIDVSEFKPSKGQRRTSNRNTDLIRNATSPWATEDQYALFRSYLDDRHADGGMADMDVFEFAAMVEETPIRSRVIEYTHQQSKSLIGVSLTDVLSDVAMHVGHDVVQDLRSAYGGQALCGYVPQLLHLFSNSSSSSATSPASRSVS